MYELKRLLSRHIEENVFRYFLVLCLFAAGMMLGLLFSGNLSPELSETLTGEIGTMLEGFSQGVFDKIQILKTTFLKNLRIFLLIFISGFSLWLLPLSLGALLSFGFSIGFTMVYLAVNFDGKGLAIALVSLIFTFLINIPVYVILSVVAFNNSWNKKRVHGDGDFGSFFAVFVFLFVFSLLSVVADTFVITDLIRLICS